MESLYYLLSSKKEMESLYKINKSISNYTDILEVSVHQTFHCHLPRSFKVGEVEVFKGAVCWLVSCIHRQVPSHPGGPDSELKSHDIDMM